MFKKIALAILAIVGLFVLCLMGVLMYATTKPDTFRVERSVTMYAAPETVFPYVNDFRNWPEWSPFDALDPDMQRTYSDPSRGRDATFAWEGNTNAGAGRMTITESRPFYKVVVDLEFLKPFETKNLTEFTFTPRGDSTQVTWAMSGPNPYFTKVITVFVNMDEMIGGDFENGLLALQERAEEKQAEKDAQRMKRISEDDVMVFEQVL